MSGRTQTGKRLMNKKLRPSGKKQNVDKCISGGGGEAILKGDDEGSGNVGNSINKDI